VVSPIDGVVMRRDAEIGLLASAGKPLYVIGDPTQFEIVIDLSPRYIQMVRNGEEARYLTPSGTWEPAAVKRVDPMANVVTGLYNVVLDVKATNANAVNTKAINAKAINAKTINSKAVNAKSLDAESVNGGGAQLHVGASVEAQIRIEHSESVVVVPYESVREIEGVAKVYVCSGDVAVERVIRRGRTNEQGQTHILSGLERGESIVFKGADRMYDGAKIWIQES
jgi:hypothetical protein